MRQAILGSRFKATTITIAALISYAYDTKIEQISGGPGWIQDDRYDIDGVSGGAASLSPAQAKLMVQSLLKDRFHARFHKETRISPIYALVVAKGGPKLKESVSDTANLTIGTGGGPFRGVLHLIVKKGTMTQLANQFSNRNGVDRFVVDQTGLKKEYDYQLDWNPSSGGQTADTDIPGIFAALDQQLGLKLESQTGLVEALFVDELQRPSEN